MSCARGPLLAVCVWTLAAILPASLHAQPGPSESDRAYEAAVGQALSELKAGRFLEARALFQEAHALKPSARTLRGLGVVALELHRYAEADQLLRRALDDPRRPLTERQRNEAEVAVARLKGLVGRYTITRVPAEAALHLDGADVVLQGDELGLDIGTYELTADAPGHLPYRGTLQVRGGERERIDIVLAKEPKKPPPVAIAPAPPPRAPTPRTQPSDPKRGDRVWGWTTIGVGAALVVTGSVLLAVGMRDVSKVENASDGTSWSSIEGARDRAPILTSIGAVSIGVGLGSAALGLWILQRKEPARRGTVDVALSPFGISLHGSI